jgi:NHL repeat-containing protein
VIRPRHSKAAAGLVVLSILMAACGGTASPSSGAASTPTPPSPPISLAASASPASTRSPASTPAPSPAPALKLLWEKSGPTQPTPCCQTWWPAVDPQTGDVWVADSFASQFWIFAADGTYRGSWGTPGSGPGELDLNTHRGGAPQAAGGIAFAPRGDFYVADTGNHRVEHFDKNRKFVSAFGSFGTSDGQFAQPFGIVTDGHTVDVADDDRGDIQAFDATGRFLRAFGPIENNAGIFVAIDAKGTLYRAAGSDEPTKILVYDDKGNVAKVIDLGPIHGVVVGLAFDPTGNLYTNTALDGSDTRSLVKIDATGKVIAEWSTGGETAVVDPSGGAIYEASDGNPAWPTASLRKYALPTK